MMNPLYQIQKFPLASISERLLELADTMAKMDLAPVLSDGDLQRLVSFRLERNR